MRLLNKSEDLIYDKVYLSYECKSSSKKIKFIKYAGIFSECLLSPYVTHIDNGVLFLDFKPINFAERGVGLFLYELSGDEVIKYIILNKLVETC